MHVAKQNLSMVGMRNWQEKDKNTILKNRINLFNTKLTIYDKQTKN